MTKKSDPETVWTLSVPQAGKKYLGLGERSAYRAAASGLIPTITVGGKKRVPAKILERQLGARNDDDA
jgi:hypothetical protein